MTEVIKLVSDNEDHISYDEAVCSYIEVLSEVVGAYRDVLSTNDIEATLEQLLFSIRLSNCMPDDGEDEE